MRIWLAASCFAFVFGISLALPPAEASARGGGLAGRAIVRAGGVRPHTFVRPINPHLTRPFHNRGNLGFGLLRRPRSFEQNFRVDMWNVCRGYAATRNGSFVK
jgi:hypothetical protein